MLCCSSPIMQPGYYAPPAPPTPDRNVITATDVLIPIGLSVFCGFGGFVWGLVRMSQGHHKPGWVAIGINAGLWALSLAVWVLIVVVFAGAVAAVPTPKVTPAPVGTALGTPAVIAPAPVKNVEKKPALEHRKQP